PCIIALCHTEDEYCCTIPNATIPGDTPLRSPREVRVSPALYLICKERARRICGPTVCCGTSRIAAQAIFSNIICGFSGSAMGEVHGLVAVMGQDGNPACLIMRVGGPRVNWEYIEVVVVVAGDGEVPHQAVMDLRGGAAVGDRGLPVRGLERLALA